MFYRTGNKLGPTDARGNAALLAPFGPNVGK
jgi:hypothetical protein